MKRLLWIGLFMVFAVPAFAGKCVNPAGSGGCFNTIQGAIDAAVAGETVTVYPGIYFENVTIPSGKDGLVLRGVDVDSRARTILDPDSPNSGNGITIQSSNVRVSFLTIRNGQADGIYINAPGVFIVENVLLSPDSDGVSLTSSADGAHLVRNEIYAVGDEAIYSTGTDNVTIEANTIGPCDDGCLSVDGNDMQILRNTITQSEDDDCIYIGGDRSIIQLNNLSYCDGDGIEHAGSNPIITENVIRGSGGIDSNCNSCTGGLIAQNSIIGVGDDEGGLDIYADAAGLVVSDNVVKNVSDEGAYISGTGIVFRDNLIRDNGGDDYEPGIEIYGAGHEIRGNRSIRNADQGFYISCTNCTIAANVATSNFTDGFEINGTGNTLTNNQATGNAGEGFQVNGSSQTLTKNTAKKNRYDYCETTSGHTLTNNTFLTTGACAIDN